MLQPDPTLSVYQMSEYHVHGEAHNPCLNPIWLLYLEIDVIFSHIRQALFLILGRLHDFASANGLTWKNVDKLIERV